ncbi:beta-ketoacyl synthase N-terminal-like domain-containing protein [Paenibacillus ehimensis]|uniref:type I polyketide synthase n=1 Tax=Paenibacillus ehimensis TaxID=79264 RepID=UPI002DC0110B|nr:polyketide synthase [Paenibacillus ehimensis]MEC0207770.1 beta-ketoacyl synthase N-terminal-like domain-containing protein [Paenibacillus ehimensis]
MEAITRGGELRGIAIIGMAGRFPGAGDLEQFWTNLRDGQESITSFKEPEKNRVHAAGILEEAADFDAVFFGMTPREAEMTDPQHRLFLECAYEALESAGYPPTRCPERVGVYAGSGHSDYLQHVLSHDELAESFGPFQIGIGNHPDFLATRVSYKFNLSGPSVAVQTACSSSLVAVHMACQALLTYECDMAIAGGVSVKADQKAGFDYQEGGILSPDGRCRAFDAKSQGTAVGNGAGAVLLKRLEEAVSDGDTILAVIRGSAVNNDGAQKVGYTAPSVARQAEVVREALAVSEIDPATMTYIEAHGTGTALGDPVEVAALTEAYREAAGRKQYCAIGSVKTNIGHLDSAAGIAGLIKTVLCLQNKMLPPSLHYTEPNPKIDFANSPFYVNDRLREWKTDGHPRRAGVSSFGMGGTNAHVVLEEAPLAETARHPEERDAFADVETGTGPGTERGTTGWNVIVLSAKTDTALRRKTERLIGYLQADRDVPLSDVAYTLAAGRETFARRLAVVGRDSMSVADGLKAKLADLPPSGRGAQEPAGGGEPAPGVTFMFTGQGAQHIYMGAELYESAPVYREQADRCAERLQPLLGLDLRNVLYPPPSQAEEAASLLRQTALTQPALFVLEYALAKQLEAWGVRPQAMIGHSIGEYVAACLAGVMAVDDALTAVAARGSLMQEMDRGAMLATALSEAEVRELLAAVSPELSVAAVNGPMSCVVSGPFEAIERLEQALGRRNAVSKRLATSHAYHSAMMEPMLERFAGVMRGIALHAPQLPYVSNVTGTWITAGQATDPMYWVRHLRDTVRFADGIRLLAETGRAAFLEIGPGQSLTSLVRQQVARSATSGALAVNTLPPAAAGKSAYASVLQALGELWSAGADIDCAAWHEGKARRRVPLPTYPFERYRYYLEKKVRAVPADAGVAGGQERRADMADWFYAPVWKQTFLPPQPPGSGAEVPHKRTYLLFHDRHGLGEALSESLKRKGHDVVAVLEGSGFRQVEEDVFTVHPAQGRSYEELLHALAAQQRFPDAVLHLWNVVEPESEGEAVPVSIAQRYARAQQLGLYSLMHLAQAIGMQVTAKPTELIALTGSLQWVAHEQVRSPERATLLGALRIIPQEYAQIRTRAIDVSLADLASASFGRLTRQLLQEIEHGGEEFIVAYRGMQRFTQIYEAVKLPEAGPADAAFRDGGVYLVTGATSEIGLQLCEEIARTAKVSFVLIGDVSFPDADEWEHYLRHNGDSGDTFRIIKRIRALEQNGTPLFYASADLTDEAGLRDIVRQAERRFGAIHGVLFAQEPYGSGLIQLGDRGRSERVIAPQVLGLLALESLLRSHPLELMIVFSRTISFTGGVGLMDQCASHHFVDAFARWHAAAGGRTVSVNWGMWQDDVWVRKQTQLPADVKEHMLQMQAKFGITGAEGLEAIRRIAASGLSQAVVSTQSIHDAAGSGWVHTAGHAASDSRNSRTDTKYRDGEPSQEPPQTEAEHKIAAIWETLFGIPGIGRRQSFFDLGGNSLLSIQLVARLRQAFHGDIPMDVIFQSPTIAELAESIAQTQVKPEELDEIERLLSEIENMPQDELMQLLSREG